MAEHKQAEIEDAAPLDLMGCIIVRDDPEVDAWPEDERDLYRHQWETFEDRQDALSRLRTEKLARAAVAAGAASDSAAFETLMQAAGFEKRYRLVGHPAYPDPLNIWPPTVQNAERVHREFCVQTFEEYIEKLGYTPLRYSHGPRLTAEDWDPRILITWEHTGEKQRFEPSEQ